MLISHRLDAKAVARERAAALEGYAEKKVGEGIAGVGSIEREVAAAARRICSTGVVSAQQNACLEHVGAMSPHRAVIQFVLVVPELDRAERVRVETQITRKPEARKPGKIRPLFLEAPNAGQHGMVGPQSLRLVEKPGSHIIEPKLVECRRAE